MSQNLAIKPVRVAGIFCILLTLLGFSFQFYALAKLNFDVSFKYFVAIVTVFHLLVGIGILSQKLWGYYIMKAYLYFMILGFPIGTLLSLKALKYLKANNIKELYKSKST